MHDAGEGAHHQQAQLCSYRMRANHIDLLSVSMMCMLCSSTCMPPGNPTAYFCAATSTWWASLQAANAFKLQAQEEGR
jgi:hypothetical protein